MILKKVQVRAGNLEYTTNCYIIIDEETKIAMVVDPGGESNKILDILKYNEAKLDYIVLTHGHADHMGALKEIKENTGAKICIHRIDAIGLNDISYNLAEYVGIENPKISANIYLKENDILNVGKIEFKIIHTPGHTEGSICLYTEGVLLSGDTLFRGTWGRTDLPTSSFEKIIQSIEKKLMLLPDNTVVYPGHGKTTLIGDEKHIYLELKPY